MRYVGEYANKSVQGRKKKSKGTDGRRKIYKPLESTRVEKKDALNSNQAYEGGLIVKKRKVQA